MGDVRRSLPDGHAFHALAHVAVELVIDGELVRGGHAVAFDDTLAWAVAELDGPWRAAAVRLAGVDLLERYGTVDGVVERACAVVAGRPRFRDRVDALDRTALESAIAPLRASVAPALDDLMRFLEQPTSK
jgi:hypothetical protein